MTPPARWTTDELARRALLEQGVAVAVNFAGTTPVLVERLGPCRERAGGSV